jgi:hypothetical protein
VLQSDTGQSCHQPQNHNTTRTYAKWIRLVLEAPKLPKTEKDDLDDLVKYTGVKIIHWNHDENY